MLDFDKKFLSEDVKLIAGIDEAGRGPLAGPVCVACVIMPPDFDEIEGVNDSKKLTPKKRDMLFDKIKEQALDYSICFVDEKTIDRINILEATKLGMKNCLNQLSITPDLVLIDAVKIESNFKTVSIIKGDAQSYAIACASILAKVSRDRLMEELAKKYPEYGFEKHKGYGTALHICALDRFGPCEIHRKTFITHFVKL